MSKRTELVKEIIKVVEHYKNGELYPTGAMTDIGILLDEIENRAKKNLLNAYYVAIHERNMSVEDIMQSIEADRDFLDGEQVLNKAKNILNDR